MIVSIISHKAPLVNHFSYKLFTKSAKMQEKFNFGVSIPDLEQNSEKSRYFSIRSLKKAGQKEVAVR